MLKKICNYKSILHRLALVSLVFIIGVHQDAFALCAARSDLNGIWKADDGGTYYVRQIGDDVWWLGMSGDNGRSWTNVYKGKKIGNRVEGQWADVPRGHINGKGLLNFNIQTSGNYVKAFTKDQFTGGFGGSRWSINCNDVILNPVDN